ncbi:MAG: Glu/Leu/Phe/Val dehydrogenase [Candidatus Gracilibacteria bacterium]
MSLFENTLKQIEKAATIMSLDPNVKALMEHPQRIVEVSIPVKMDDGSLRFFQGFRVQHSNYAGPYKGGIRYHQNVDMGEVQALSAWMSIKCSVVGIPLGGGKGGIVVNPKELSVGELERLTRGYIRAIADVIGPTKDVPAPDVNTTPQIMDWIVDEYLKIKRETGELTSEDMNHMFMGVVTGKTLEHGGSKGRNIATAQGGVYVLDEVAKEKGFEPANTKVIIQGFGNAGGVMAQLLAKKGYQIVGASDSQGGLIFDKGCDPEKLLACKAEKATVINCDTDFGGRRVTNEELLETECDILILAALENQVHAENADKVKAKMILELANGPTTPEADEILAKKGIMVIPDILANSGGVTVSWFEMLQNAENKYWTEEEALQKLLPIMVDGWKAVKGNADKYNCTLREAAYVTALARIEGKIREKGIL